MRHWIPCNLFWLSRVPTCEYVYVLNSENVLKSFKINGSEAANYYIFTEHF